MPRSNPDDYVIHSVFGRPWLRPGDIMGHFRTSEPLTVHAGSASPSAIGLHFSGVMLMRLFFVFLVVMCAGQTAATAQKSDQLAELHQQVVALYRAGKYVEATEVARRATTVAVAKFGPDHPHVGTSLNDLAVLYHAQGRYAEAEPLYKRSLSIREKAKGADHPDVGQSLNNLAGLYESQGRYAEAEPLYKRSL
ncbi:MAG: tetratricopeptide repeat protein, partial [Pseudomonadota bacterium]